MTEVCLVDSLFHSKGSTVTIRGSAYRMHVCIKKRNIRKFFIYTNAYSQFLTVHVAEHVTQGSMLN